MVGGSENRTLEDWKASDEVEEDEKDEKLESYQIKLQIRTGTKYGTETPKIEVSKIKNPSMKVKNKKKKKKTTNYWWKLKIGT